MHYNNLMSLSVCQLVGRGMQQVHIHRFPPALTAVVPLLVWFQTRHVLSYSLSGQDQVVAMFYFPKDCNLLTASAV